MHSDFYLYQLTDFGLSKIGLINSAMDLSTSGTTDSILLDAQNQHAFSANSHQRLKRSRRSAVGTPDYLAPEILLGTAHGLAHSILQAFYQVFKEVEIDFFLIFLQAMLQTGGL